MVLKLIVFLILVGIVAFSLPQLPSIQFTPEVKQERLKAEFIVPSPLEYPNLRWNHMPISVLIYTRTASESSYPSDVKFALDKWRDATNGVISFELTENKDADITIEWVKKLKSESLDAAGNTDIKFFNQTKFKILTKADIQLLNVVEGQELTNFDMTNLAVHEIGHALGLNHNDAEDSIMNPTLKIPSKEIKAITRPEIQPLLDTYRILPKPDLYVSPNSTVTKIFDKYLFKENYYINATIAVENIGMVNSANIKILIKADDMIVREDESPEIPLGSIFTRTYVNLPVDKNFSFIEVIVDPENLVDELDEGNNRLVLRV